MPIPNPQSPIPQPRSLPRWLKRNVPKGNANHFTAKLIGQLGLQTVCDHAKCPNRMECYSQKTATFMILGDICTRGCRFCSVQKGKPLPVDPDEPRRVAEAARELGLKHVVITCVTRDDLPDGGAEHFVQTIEAVRGGKGDSPICAKHPEGRSGKAGPSPFPPDHRSAALRFRRQRGGRRSADRGGAGRLQPQHGNRAAAVPDGARSEGELRAGRWKCSAASAAAIRPSR